MKKHLLAFALGLGLLDGALAQQPKDIKFSVWLPPTHPMIADLEKWGKSLSDASGGTLKVTLYPAAQLGKAPDHYDMARDGIVDMALIAPGYTPGRFPIWTVLELPFTFANSVGGARGLHEWYTKYMGQEMGDVKVCMVSVHHPGIFHTKAKQLAMPTDLKGLRIRPGGPIIAQYINANGGSTVQASLPEVRELAERGVVDGVTFPWDILVIGADPVLRYHMDEEIYVTSQVHAMNKSTYDSLTPQQKKAVDAHCSPEWSERIAANWAKQELAARDKLKSMPGHTVYKITPQQRAAWQQAAVPLNKQVYDAVEKRFKLDGATVYKELTDALARHNANYSAK
jgi:TRAP-type C4-dicarboxylate transport system substrate-binding protein